MTLTTEGESTVPRQEFDDRVVRTRELMAKEGFDVIVASDTGERHIPGGHVRYLANFTVNTLHSAVVIPIQGDATLVVQPGNRNCFPDAAHRDSWIKDVRSTPTKSWPPRQVLGPDIASAITDMGYASGHIGMCGKFPESDKLGELLPKAEISAALDPSGKKAPRDLVERVRARKSPWEIEQLRQAQVYAEAGIKGFYASIEPDRKFVRSVAEGEWAAMSLGADDFFIYMASGGSGKDPWVWWTDQDQRHFRAGDLVAAEANARCEGYLAQIARSGAIGKATPTQERLIAASTDALSAIAESLKVGVTGGELFEIGAKVVRAAGFSPNARYGHGMGISMAESFDIMAEDDVELEEGYSIEIHPGVFDPDGNQSVLIGDQFTIINGVGIPLSDAVLPHDLGPRA